MAILSERKIRSLGLTMVWAQGGNHCISRKGLSVLGTEASTPFAECGHCSLQKPRHPPWKPCLYLNELGQILVETDPHVRGHTNPLRTDFSKGMQRTGTWVNTGTIEGEGIRDPPRKEIGWLNLVKTGEGVGSLCESKKPWRQIT